MVRNKSILNIISYTISICLYIFFMIITYSSFFNLNIYYLFITIPTFFLLSTLTIMNIAKTILTVISILFGRNGNDEINDAINKKIENTNRLSKYALIAIFFALLFSVMLLDIIYCVIKEQFLLLALSITIWIILYYVLIKLIIKIIKHEIYI